MKKAIEVFSSWAKLGKDEGMRKNHYPAFLEIKEIIRNSFKSEKNITVGDFGCGNGWATDELLKEKNIKQAVGYDGSRQMIKKAKKNFLKPSFIETDLNQWKEEKEFNIIYSMEFLYYLKKPEAFVASVCSHNLKANGMFIAGIDHYLENKQSLGWSRDLNVRMKTKSINEWEALLKEAGLKKVKSAQINQKPEWGGTLIIYGVKNAL